MDTNNFTLSNIRTDFQSLNRLASLYKFLYTSESELIKLKLETWFGGNICSPLGGIVYKAKELGKKLEIESMPNEIESILRKNKFLEVFDFQQEIDTYNTTIPYIEFDVKNEFEFLDYVEKRVLARSDFPNMSDALKRKIAESLFEIFNNSKIHSDSKVVFCCGQFFPKKNTIEFSITDIGIGIRKRIQSSKDFDLPADTAIKWAMGEGNSTKHDDPGGLGLALLGEFIRINRGAIQIVSDMGYYKLDEEGEFIKKMDCHFPGTCINMKFRTDDASLYCLSNELDSADIF